MNIIVAFSPSLHESPNRHIVRFKKGFECGVGHKIKILNSMVMYICMQQIPLLESHQESGYGQKTKQHQNEDADDACMIELLYGFTPALTRKSRSLRRGA